MGFVLLLGEKKVESLENRKQNHYMMLNSSLHNSEQSSFPVAYTPSALDCCYGVNSENKTVNNRTESNHRDTPEPPLYILVTGTSFYVLIFFFGIVGNLLVILTVTRIRSMRSKMYFFMMNLSLADLLVLLVCMPVALMELYAKDVWYLGHGMCKLVPFLENCVSLASSLTILAISFDRYRGICDPLKTNKGKPVRSFVIIVNVIWITSAISSSPMTMMAVFRDSKHLDGTPIKVCRSPIEGAWSKAYVVGVFVCFFIVPLFILIFFYVMMSRKLIQHSRFLKQNADKEAEANIRRRKQIVLMLLVVVCVFFVCLLPYRVVSLWLVFGKPEHLQQLGLAGYLSLLTFMRVMMYLNSAMNPIIYNCMSKQFRNSVLKTIGITQKRRNRHGARTSSGNNVWV